MTKRTQRVNQLIKKELGGIIARELDLPQDVLVTVTRVEALPNLQAVKVYISAIPDKETASVMLFLQKKVFYFQQMLNRRLVMRPIPKIVFVEEKATKEAARVEELMEKLNKND